MSGLDSIYSAVSSIGQKVSAINVASTIQAGVDNISAAAASASQAVVLKIQSKFQSKDLPAAVAAKDSLTPNEVMMQKSSFAGALTFPSEMKYFTKFSFYEYNKKNVTDRPKDLPTQVVILPMPNNLQETFGVDYDTPSLGPIAGAATSSLINAIRGDTSSIPTTPTDVKQTVTAAAAAGSMNLVKKLTPTGGAIESLVAGVAPNPNMAVLFSNIHLRTHSFSYKFAPTSAKELSTLKSIIAELKTRMLPGMAFDGNMLFTFPDVCDIEFGPDKTKPYKIKRCVMDNLSVNYTPMGSPAFFKTGDPVMVEISMSFKEMSPFTRHDMKDTPSSSVAPSAGNPPSVDEINPQLRH